MALELSSLAASGKGLKPNEGFQAIYPGTSQQVATSAVSAQSAAVGAKTSIVRLYCTEDVWIKFGANPTAIADGTCMFLKAETTEYFGIQPGWEIAAIRESADGELYITEGAQG